MTKLTRLINGLVLYSRNLCDLIIFFPLLTCFFYKEPAIKNGLKYGISKGTGQAEEQESKIDNIRHSKTLIFTQENFLLLAIKFVTIFITIGEKNVI